MNTHAMSSSLSTVTTGRQHRWGNGRDDAHPLDGRRPAIRTGLLPSVCNDADRIQIGLWPYRGRAEAVAAALGDETRVIARALCAHTD
eukprot:scaffold12444_cov51-Phaeocystis_antarctica.AAC.1